MTHALYYPPADHKRQWAFDRYPGDVMDTNTVVLHTTETITWPSYSTGYWPNLTYHPGASKRWRQHLPLNRSGRALENDRGGVETNTLNCIQVEMIGTCDPDYKHAHPTAMFYDEPTDEVIEDIARFAAFMFEEWGVKLVAAPKWLHYDDSYGSKHGQRFTAQQWLDFYGWCGHEHVVENVHGDPGAFPIAKVLDRARDILNPPKPQPADPKPAPFPREDAIMSGIPARLVQLQKPDGSRGAAVYAVTLAGAVHIKNPNHLSQLAAAGWVEVNDKGEPKVHPVGQKVLDDLLEVEK